MTRAKSSTLEAGFCGWDLPGEPQPSTLEFHAKQRAGGVRLKEGVPTLGHVRGKDPADTSYREAMTKETPGGME